MLNIVYTMTQQDLSQECKGDQPKKINQYNTPH